MAVRFRYRFEQAREKWGTPVYLRSLLERVMGQARRKLRPQGGKIYNDGSSMDHVINGSTTRKMIDRNHGLVTFGESMHTQFKQQHDKQKTSLAKTTLVVV